MRPPDCAPRWIAEPCSARSPARARCDRTSSVPVPEYSRADNSSTSASTNPRKAVRLATDAASDRRGPAGATNSRRSVRTSNVSANRRFSSRSARHQARNRLAREKLLFDLAGEIALPTHLIRREDHPWHGNSTAKVAVHATSRFSCRIVRPPTSNPYLRSMQTCHILFAPTRQNLAQPQKSFPSGSLYDFCASKRGTGLEVSSTSARRRQLRPPESRAIHPGG